MALWITCSYCETKALTICDHINRIYCQSHTLSACELKFYVVQFFLPITHSKNQDHRATLLLHITHQHHTHTFTASQLTHYHQLSCFIVLYHFGWMLFWARSDFQDVPAKNRHWVIWARDLTRMTQLLQHSEHSNKYGVSFGNKTCLNIKHHCFIFQHIVQIQNAGWTKIYTRYVGVRQWLDSSKNRFLQKAFQNLFLHEIIVYVNGVG